MSLPKPVLDNRTFAELVAEGTSQINRLSPGWTNYNASDPGITLLELFAWLTEQDLYRTDRVTDEMTRAFLRLVEVTQSPPNIAETAVLISTSGAIISLPDRIQLSDPYGAITFETRDALAVSNAVLTQILAGSTLADITAGFLPFGAAPAAGDCLYLGFDRAFGAVGATVSLYAWTLDPAKDETIRAALLREFEWLESAAKACGCPASSVADWRDHYEVRTIWEYHTAAGSWAPLPQLVDETRALTLSGFIRFAIPADHAAGGPEAKLWFIRCRIVCGTFECAPRLDRIGINAVIAEHAASIASPELLGISTGHAGEVFTAAQNPVVAGSTQLSLVNGAEHDDAWEEAAQWDLSGPHDKHYLLLPELGQILAGNGMRGVVPPAGAQLFLNYRVGGGVEGNIAAGTLTRPASGAWNAGRIPGGNAAAALLSVVQPVAANGGAAAETLAAAEARAVTALAVPTRTVTLGDIVTLACSVPGIAAARGAALPNTHPAVPCFTAPGCITVIVVPNCPGPAPMPTAGFLRGIAAYLGHRRPAATELHVIAPTYVTVAVTATLQAAGTVGAATLPALAVQALDVFFNPLLGGPGGAGWPIGRAVYRTEVMALLSTLPGVLSVTDLTLQADDAAPVCGNIDICAHDLIRSGQHKITLQINGTRIFNRSSEREC